ncbi:Methyl-accepting chemotaxis protein [Butyrivibrio sp. ob235]|uniref:methyl-accepting chemotaxis protein n=1 Tax=Butyrivibrio sp. ob235 TaxID=1761780 RepID=UPI0008C5CAF6|nr:methyl-accepting chemotaxis protein [Butyrivibrio sp. ob235]SEM29028.1 Methyl-accepting chemotaxis protein [Butyrivibrio sp. ob235]
MSKVRNTNKKTGSKGNFFQSVKGKILFMGVLGIAAALIIGVVGATSINKNAQNSEIVSLVDEVNVLQAQNLANDALYQYYVDENYLDATLTNLDEMGQKSGKLQTIAGPGYQESISAIISNVDKSKSNYNELKKIHSSRGYESSAGKYQEYTKSSQDLADSFTSLVNNNDWIEIHWIDATFGEGGSSVSVDGKNYTKMIYKYALPEAGKRNNLIFRVGGTFSYKGAYYIKNIKLMNGSEELPLDLSQMEIAEMSGDGLESAELADFGGETAIKVNAKYDEANATWEEVSTAISVVDYDMENYPDLYYELYIDPSIITPGVAFKYGGAISGVYGFASELENLDSMVATYSKLVVEGKDVSGNLSDIEALMAEIEENIPKYTTDPSLAEISQGFLNSKKALFEELKTTDQQTLALKADNLAINTALSELSESVQGQAVNDMNSVRSSVTVIILVVLIISVVVLLIILGRISLGINKSVKSFQSAIEEIASGKISSRANDSGKDEFADFASSLNNFLDTLEGTIDKVKEVSDILADTGLNLEESASKTKQVAGEISETISEISKGAGEQAKDIETSSQKVVDIRSNIQQILDSVSNLSDKSESMSTSGKEANSNMTNLTRSSDSTTDAFTRIVSQVHKTDESVGKIQEAVSLIASVADQINLLSLNASIEAARAGDAGRGFAVVASEISNLADQTNQSTKIIEDIIHNLSEESNKTVATINEVTELIDEQKTSIDETSNIFEDVSIGIDFTKESVVDVLDQAKSCETSGETVVDLMTNLSAISQENAASAETTSSSMAELNKETARLADASVELKRLADELKEDLEFFK